MAFGKKHSLIALLGLATISGAAWWYQKTPSTPGSAAGESSPAVGAGGGKAGAPRVASVEVAQVETASLQDDAQAIGTLKSRQNVMLRPEVAGRVTALGFTDGGRVRAGQVLVQFDDTLQRAEVKQSLAQVSIAQSNFKRNQELVAQNFVAQRVLEESSASVQVAQAQLALSCARLGRMAVVAPFDGVVGLRNVNLGDYVKDGADLVNLEDLGSMLLDFRLPERFAGKVRAGQTVSVTLDAFPNRQFKAKIEAVDPLLDTNARSVGMRAVLPNTAGEPIAVPSKTGAAPGSDPRGAVAQAPKPAVAAKPMGYGTPPVKGKASPESTTAPALASLKESLAQAGCAAPSDSARTGPGAVTTSVGKKPAGVPAMPAAKSGGASPAPLRPGMFARVTTIFAVREKALVVPEEAVVPQGGRQYVVRVVKAAELPPAVSTPPTSAPSGATATPPAAPLAPDAWVSLRQEVKLGLRKQGKVEVTEGLLEGQTVVVAGHQRLQKDGTPVKIVEVGKPPASSGAAPSPIGAPVAPASR